MPDTTCSVPGCTRGGQLSRGLCSTHYARLWRRGDVNAPDLRKRKRRVETPCAIDGCERTASKRGLCDMHYKRQWRTGDPLTVRRISKLVGDCRIDGCERAAAVRDLCKLHDRRQRQYGDPLALTPPRQKRPVKRYRRVYEPGHPLANREGAIGENRYVLFNAIGEGPHPCHWCGKPVHWRTGSAAIKNLVVDHLDHDKLNNSASNLVPACNPCNGHRLAGDAWEPWTPGTPVGRSLLHAQCRRGHLLTEDNIYVRPDTSARQCLTCLRAATKRRYEARTPEQRASDLARNRQPIPCPACGELKGRSSMRRHIRDMHEKAAEASASRDCVVATTAAGIRVVDITRPEPEGLW